MANKNLQTFLVVMVLILSSFSLVKPVSAETLKLDCYSANGCDLCDAMVLVIKIAKFILGVTGSLALLFFIISGFLMIVGQGNPQNVTKAKQILISAVVGLIIVFGAWTIVNFTLSAITGGQTEFFGKPWDEFVCVQTSITTEKTLGGGDCGGLLTSGINPSQCNDASTVLTQLLQCIKDHWSEYGLQQEPIITSICDDKGCERCRTNWQPYPSCSHSQHSYHYCLDGSHAADFRSTGYNDTQWAYFNNLVTNCGGTLNWENRGSTDPNKPPHFHAEIQAGCRRN